MSALHLGDVSKASQTLTAPFAPPGVETVKALQDLHPGAHLPSPFFPGRFDPCCFGFLRCFSNFSKELLGEGGGEGPRERSLASLKTAMGSSNQRWIRSKTTSVSPFATLLPHRGIVIKTHRGKANAENQSPTAAEETALRRRAPQVRAKSPRARPGMILIVGALR